MNNYEEEYTGINNSERYLMIGLSLITRVACSRLTSFADEFWLRELPPVAANILLLFLYALSNLLPLSILYFFVIKKDERIVSSRSWINVRGENGKKLIGAVSALGIAFLAGAVGSLVTALFEKIGLSSASSSLVSSSGALGIAFYFVYSVILVPIFEELFYRAALLRSLEVDSKATAVVFSALFFALFHSPSSMIYAFASGLVFGALALRYGITVTFCAHAINNLISTCLMVLGRSTDNEILCYIAKCALGIAFAIVAIVWCCLGCHKVFTSLGKVKWKVLASPAIMGFIAFVLFIAVCAFI